MHRPLPGRAAWTVAGLGSDPGHVQVARHIDAGGRLNRFTNGATSEMTGKKQREATSGPTMYERVATLPGVRPVRKARARTTVILSMAPTGSRQA